MNLTWKKNEVSGNLEAAISAKLLSVSETVLTLNNEKNTEYRVCAIQLPNGKNVTAIMYEANFIYGVTPGTNYSCRVIRDTKREDNSVLITMSHLVAAERATLADFGLDSEPEVASISKGVSAESITSQKVK